jgi:putative hydrolase
MSAPDLLTPKLPAPNPNPTKPVATHSASTHSASTVSPATSVGRPRKDSLNENRYIAGLISEVADLLEAQHADPFRVTAYRNAATTLLWLESPIRQIAEREGVDGLMRLQTIGHSIASLVDQYVRTGRVMLLDRLRGEATAERIFTTVPTIGPELALRIYGELHIETLPELYQATLSGKLDEVPGIGQKRIRAIHDCLARRLGGHANPTMPPYPATDRSIPIAEILDIDAEYKKRVAEDRLPKIAPVKFNPGGVAWLPIMHTVRDDRHYTALFSNTARAHDLNTTKDWVLIYRDDDRQHARWTVITSQFGKLRGCRIVRGREDECREFYLRQGAS